MILQIGIALVIVAVGFAVLERFWPSIRGQRTWRRPGMFTDISYFFINPTLGRLLSGIAILASIMTLGATRTTHA